MEVEGENDRLRQRSRMTPDIFEVTLARRQPSSSTFRPLDENPKRLKAGRSDERPEPGPIELGSVLEVVSSLRQVAHQSEGRSETTFACASVPE